MAYLKERMNGTVVTQPHKMRVMLRGKISNLLTQYTLDEVLGEIAAQRPTFDIHLVVAGRKAANGQEALSDQQ
jgi:hypothetical protein